MMQPRTLHRGWGRFGLALALCSAAISSGLAFADSEGQVKLQRDPSAENLVTHAQSAGRFCKAGDLDRALFHLEALHAGLVADVGIAHSATQIVSLSLAQVARGIAGGTRPHAPSSIQGSGTLDPTVARALSALRPCSRVKAAGPPSRLAVPAAEEEGFDAHLQAARVLAHRGQYKAAVVAADRAHSLALQESKPGRRVKAASTVALLRLQIGDFEGASLSAREADAVAAKEGDLGTRVSMARVFAALRHLSRAGDLLDAVAEEVQDDSKLGAEFQEARGDLALRLGAPGRAIHHLDRAVAGHREHFGRDHPSTASALQLRGDAFRMAGDIPAAQSDLRAALSIRESVYGATHPEVSRTRNALGVLFADLRDWSAADRLFELALEALIAEFGERHPEVVTVRANRVLVAWGKEPSVVEAFRYAATLDAFAIAYGEDHPIISEASRNLARMQELLGDAAAAEALFDRALESQLRALGPEHPALAQTLLARGRFFGREGHLEQANRELERAIVLLRDHYGDEHPLVARARSARSHVSTARGDWQSAWTDAQEAARVFDLHLQRSFGAISDRQRILLAADAAEVVGALLSANRNDPRAAYVSLIPQRDSVLRSIAVTRARQRERVPAGDRSLGELEQLRTRYVAAVLSASQDAGVRGRALAQAIDAQESIVSLSQGSLRELSPAEVLHRACRKLPRDAALIEFVAYDRIRVEAWVDPVPAYLAIVIRPLLASGGERECSVTRIELGHAQQIDEAVDAFARAMRDQRNDARELRTALSKLLLEPLRKVLTGASRWLFVPDGTLWGVAFAALPDPERPDHYLVERVTSGTLTSIHELAHYGEGNKIVGMKALLFGAPDFGKPTDGEGPVVPTMVGPCQLDPFEPLPATVRELREIRELLPDATMVVGTEANKQRLYRELESRPAIVHFATHAYFAGGGGCEGTVARRDKDHLGGSIALAPNPLLLSGIVLAGANTKQRLGADADLEASSGILTALEAAGLDLSSSRLVVLSACDTGVGLQHRGQEVQGLRWGFRAAGAKSLVTSLWRSNDVVTRKLMRSFYASLVASTHEADLFEGAAALRSAQLERVASEQRLMLRKPLTWANFVFSGLYQ